MPRVEITLTEEQCDEIECAKIAIAAYEQAAERERTSDVVPAGLADHVTNLEHRAMRSAFAVVEKLSIP